MSSVSFVGSALRFGALSADGPAVDPFLESSGDPPPPVVDLLRLRRRRAERLVPAPVPAACALADPDPLDVGPAAGSRLAEPPPEPARWPPP